MSGNGGGKGKGLGTGECDSRPSGGRRGCAPGWKRGALAGMLRHELFFSSGSRQACQPGQTGAAFLM